MRKLNLNKTSDLLKLKESLNKTIDNMVAEKNLNEKINSISGLSFQEYKALFESVMPDLCSNANGKNIIASYVKLIKENKAINTIYKVLERTGINGEYDGKDACNVISEAIKHIDTIQLSEGEAVMYEICKKAFSSSKNTSSELIDNVLSENKNINDAIKYFTKNGGKTNLDNLSEEVKNLRILREFIESKQVKVEGNTELTKSNNELISDYNDILEQAETDTEKKVINDIFMCGLSGGNKESLFESYKNECIKSINSKKCDDDINRKSRLHGIKTQLETKKYNEETLKEDLQKLLELNGALTEED